MTRTEFEQAKELTESYWLYVVELVEQDDFRMYRIQNPASKVGYYLFDHGWMALTDGSDDQIEPAAN
jgi:hypothetical protein